MTVMATRSVDTTLAELKQRAETLVPRLRERASTAEQLRRLPDETFRDFVDAGLFRVLQPTHFGGYELDYGRTQVELCTILGRGCGSSAWIQCVLACHAWCLAMFPPAAQEAVWGSDPETLIASAFAFKTGRGRRVAGGYHLQGEWQFSSGSDLCQWIILGTPIFEDDGQTPSRPPMLWCLLPERDWEIVDVWHAAGLRGTSSNNIRVAGTFVPSEFTLDTSVCDGRPTPGSVLHSSPMYRLPVWPIFPFNVSTPVLGVARGALEAYIDYMGSRPERANMVQRQLRIAESACEIDAALAQLRANSDVLSHAIHTGEPLDPTFLCRSSRDTSYAVKLCVQAVSRLADAVGAHGMLEDTPIQRALRDVHAIANHAANSFDSQALVYARQALGLPPGSTF
jgi:3-hydroxy-9,10-secoandrosta-1,3,5(10)-triene-9,17-dione monooxygenase